MKREGTERERESFCKKKKMNKDDEMKWSSGGGSV